MVLQAFRAKPVEAISRTPWLIIDKCTNLAHKYRFLDGLKEFTVNYVLTFIISQNARLCDGIVYSNTYNQENKLVTELSNKELSP